MNTLMKTMMLSIFMLGATAVQAYEQSANVALTSNYVFRGQTLSGDNLAVQGGYDIVDTPDAGWYAGAFLSMLDTGQGMEYDIYGGWRGSFGEKDKFGYDVGLILYNYTESGLETQTEIYGGISYETAYATLYIGDDDTPNTGSYTYLDVGAAFVILKDVDLDVHVGMMSRDFAGGDYNDVSATLRKEVNEYDIALSLTYEDLQNETEFLVTVSKHFDL